MDVGNEKNDHVNGGMSRNGRLEDLMEQPENEMEDVDLTDMHDLNDNKHRNGVWHSFGAGFWL